VNTAFRIIPLLLISLVISACASNEAQDLGFSIVVEQSVQRYIWDAPESERSQRAERIRKIASDVRALASNTTVTVALLRQAAEQEIAKHDLIPPDRALIDKLLDVIVAELQARVGEGPLSEDHRVRVTAVLDWIVWAATPST
jgi:hypothetical protein